jgi:hypothetical protein
MIRNLLHRFLVVALATLAFLLAGCTPRSHLAPIVRAGEDPIDVITSFTVSNGAVSHVAHLPVPAGAYRFPLFPGQPPGLRFEPGPYEKLHPELVRRLAGGPSAALETLLVTYEDTLRIPRFPPVPGSPALLAARTAAAQALVQQIQLARDARTDADTTDLKRRYRVRVLDHFWIARSYLVEAPRDSAPVIASLPEVIYVRPDRAHEPPPQVNGSSDDDPVRARELLGTDAYAAASLQTGRLALLDTGVYTGHELLSQPAQFSRLRDCVNGGLDCNTGSSLNTGDLCPGGHGTRSAALMSGHVSPAGVQNTTGAPDDSHRGLTAIPLESYRVYGPDSQDPVCGLGLVASAYLNCVQNVLLDFGGVITIEAQAEEPDRGDIALAADGAFDGGAVVVAAVGNRVSGSSKVRAPANARRALGIGAYSVRPPHNISTDQLNGPTTDGRIKPDLQAPTSIETAKNGSPSAYEGFGGTSCATAVSGAAAALFRNLLLDGAEAIDPGCVYAGLIASGDRESPFPAVSIPPRQYSTGAGHFKLPGQCKYWMAKLSVSNDETFKYPVDLTGLGAHRIAVAIWWPEVARWEESRPVDGHSTLSLEVSDATGAVVKTGKTSGSVFERVSAPIGASPGSWVVQVKGESVRFGPQTFYLAVIADQAP